MIILIFNFWLDYEINVLGIFNFLDVVCKYFFNLVILYFLINKVYGDFEYLYFMEE